MHTLVTEQMCAFHSQLLVEIFMHVRSGKFFISYSSPISRTLSFPLFALQYLNEHRFKWLYSLLLSQYFIDQTIYRVENHQIFRKSTTHTGRFNNFNTLENNCSRSTSNIDSAARFISYRRITN